MSEVDFEVFPNPGISTVSILSEFEIDDVSILDQSGKILMKDSFQTEYDVSHLAPGIYFMKINSFGKTATQKFVING